MDSPLVLLIHGLGLNREIWRQYVPVLARSYRVLTYDLLFHGESSHAGAGPSLALYSRQIVELLDHIGIEKAALVGFSLGGMINRRFASDHPDRVSALAILNSPHKRSPEQQRIMDERAAHTAAGGPAANIDETLERWFTPEFRAARRDIIAEVRTWVLANEPVPYAQCRMMLARNVNELVSPSPPISAPTLVMTSEHDIGSTPAMAHAAAAEIAGAETVIVPRLQHLGLMEEPDAFLAPLVRFLRRALDAGDRPMLGRTGGGTAYELTGPIGAPLVVLIHGLGLNRQTWREHVPLLARHFRVLSYDLHFHGQSAAGTRPPSLALFAEQLLELLDHVGERQAALVGFSLGGMINRRFAIDHPERVSALAILNSPHERSPDQQHIVEIRAAETAAGGPAANLDQTIERWFTPGFRTARSDVIDEVRGWVLANEPGPYARCRMVLARGVTELIRPTPPIRAPMLVMTCEHDFGSTPAMARAIASETAGAETVVVSRLQHMGLMEEPEAFTEPVVRFLEKTLGS